MATKKNELAALAASIVLNSTSAPRIDTAELAKVEAKKEANKETAKAAPKAIERKPDFESAVKAFAVTIASFGKLQIQMNRDYLSCFNAKFPAGLDLESEADRTKLKSFRAELTAALVECGVTKDRAFGILSRCQKAAGHQKAPTSKGGEKGTDKGEGEEVSAEQEANEALSDTGLTPDETTIVNALLASLSRIPDAKRKRALLMVARAMVK